MNSSLISIPISMCRQVNQTSLHKPTYTPTQTPKSPTTENQTTIRLLPRMARVAALAAIFPTLPAVAPPLTLAVQLAPQTYPLGQHPPPALEAQLDHPDAQLPLPAAPAPPPSAPAVVVATLVVSAADVRLALPLSTETVTPEATRTVTPLLFTANDDGPVGQDVTPQSRPTRQQPPL